MASTPKYGPGYRVGSLEVTKYLGYDAFTYKSGNIAEEHQYECVCDCGETCVRTQRYLTNPQSHASCPTCQDMRRKDVKNSSRKHWKSGKNKHGVRMTMRDVNRLWRPTL